MTKKDTPAVPRRRVPQDSQIFLAAKKLDAAVDEVTDAAQKMVEKLKLPVLHRLIRVDIGELERMRSFEGAELVTGEPSVYAVRENGDISIWPQPPDGKFVELYVE
jgi:hypothetical protein